MKAIDLAYIAGIVDGEGYVGIKKVKALNGGRVNPSYHERIQIRMVDEPAIKFIADTLGGNYYKEKAHCNNGRPLYCFQSNDASSVHIIKSLLPYLRIKNTVALTVLQLRKLKENPDKISVPIRMRGRWGKIITRPTWRYSSEHIDNCDKLWRKCRELNRVGA